MAGRCSQLRNGARTAAVIVGIITVVSGGARMTPRLGEAAISPNVMYDRGIYTPRRWAGKPLGRQTNPSTTIKMNSLAP
jgi:hypothetical protein